jgi:hypothetical protein
MHRGSVTFLGANSGVSTAYFMLVTRPTATASGAQMIGHTSDRRSRSVLAATHAGPVRSVAFSPDGSLLAAKKLVNLYLGPPHQNFRVPVDRGGH